MQILMVFFSETEEEKTEQKQKLNLQQEMLVCLMPWQKNLD